MKQLIGNSQIFDGDGPLTAGEAFTVINNLVPIFVYLYLSSFHSAEQSA